MTLIRHATVDDAQAIGRVIISTWRDTYRGLMPDEILDNLSVEERAERWRKRLEDVNDPYHRIFVAEVDGSVVGFACYGENPHKELDYQAEIFALYILSEFRGHGVGRQLVSRCASELLKLGMRSMLIWVLSTNPYRGFYERLGGTVLCDKPGMVSGAELMKTAYGWENINLLAAMDAR